MFRLRRGMAAVQACTGAPMGATAVTRLAVFSSVTQHLHALRVSVVTGLVTNTVMHPCVNLGVGGVTSTEFMDTCTNTSLARVRVLF